MIDRLQLRHAPRRPDRFPIGVAVIAIGILVGALSWQTTMLLAVALGSFWLGLQHRDWGLGLLAVTIPMQTHLELGLQASQLTWTKIVVWSLLTGWTVALLLTRQRVSIDFVTVALFFVTAALALSVWNARNEQYWMGETYRWLVTAIVSCFAFNSFRRGGSPLPFLLGSAVGVGASVALAIWQAVFGIGPESFDVRGVLRSYGPFTHPNQLAMYLELSAPMFLALALAPRDWAYGDGWWRISRRLRPVWAAGFAIALLGLVLSQSRGGLVGMSIGLLAVLGLARPGLRLSFVRVAPVALIGATAFLTVSIGIVAAGVASFTNQETLVTPGNFAVQERLSHWAAAVEMAKEHPLLGVGAGNFDANYRDVTRVWRFRIGRGHAHDTYLHFLAQSGVVGLMAYVALLLGVALIIIRTLRILPDGSRLSLLIGAAGVTAAIATHAIFEYVHVLSLNLQLVVIWSMAAAIGAQAWNDREQRA